MQYCSTASDGKLGDGKLGWKAWTESWATESLDGKLSIAVLQATESWATESLDGKLSIGDGKLSIACSTAVLQATESWAGPGNEAIQDVGLLLASLTQCVMPRPAFEQEDVLHSCSYVPQLAQTGKQC